MYTADQYIHTNGKRKVNISGGNTRDQRWGRTPQLTMLTFIYEALHLLTQGILQRLDQSGYRMYTNLEALLVKAANKDKFDKELNIVANFYKDDINKEQLKMQLSIFSSNYSCEPTHELHNVIKYLQGLSTSQRHYYLHEVCVLASLILVMLATNAVSERSFSALRRIKSYLRATMSQE